MVITRYTDYKERLEQLKDYNLPAPLIMKPKDLINYEEGFEKEIHWYYLLDLMYNALKKARTSYGYQLVEGTIYYSILSIEYGLKLKKCIFISQTKSNEEADKWLIDKKPTLGTFSESKAYTELGIEDLNIQIRALNVLRNGLFHFNYEKLKDAIRLLGFDFSAWEKKGMTIIYPKLIDDTLAVNTNTCVINLLEQIFLAENSKD